MVRLEMLGLIGNNLFQYAVARLLAEEFGYALEVEHSPYKPAKNVPQLTKLMSSFKDAPLTIPGRQIAQPVDRTVYLDHEGFDGFRVDLTEMFSRREDRRIEVKGFFERYDIYRAHKERIREWFRVDPITCGHRIGPTDVVMHIRRGDFVTFGRAITLTFYEDLLERLDFGRLYVCGFGLDQEVKQVLARFNPTYVQGEPDEDFRFIKGFNRIVQSQSTFVWWAGFLSEAEEIYAPLTVPNSTEFERAFPHIDLRIDDEPRYRYIENVPQMEREFGLGDIVRARRHLHLHDLRPLAGKMVRRAWGNTAGRGIAFGKRLVDGEVGTIMWARESVRWNLIYRMRKYRDGQYQFSNGKANGNGGAAHKILDKYRKIVVIRINHSYAGFFAYFTFALNQILFCERNNCLPVVHFGEWSTDGKNAYFDPAFGTNMWEYYFKPLGGVSYDQVQEWIADPDNPVTADDVVELTDQDLWHLHLHEKESVFAYTYGRYMLKDRYDPTWYDHQRRRAHAVIERHVELKTDIEQQVDAYVDEFMAGHYMIGVHLRGTDKGAARGAANTRIKIGPVRYYREIDRVLRDHPDARLFVATDQVQYLDAVRERYGDRVLSTDCMRSTGDLAPFQLEEGSGYMKGREVLVDALLLSKCDYLVKCSSHVGEAALWFNPDIPNVDVNYAS